jgi:hypothetical protein
MKFAGDPGTCWANSTDKAWYQLKPDFKACCGLCWQYGGHISGSWGIPFHNGCLCIQRPIWPGEVSDPFFDQSELLSSMSPEQQDALIGRNSWCLLAAGLVRWSDVVTSSRVREFVEVMDREKISIPQMISAGIPEAEAKAAWALVFTPERMKADADRKEALRRLKEMGFSDDEIRARFSAAIVRRTKT